MRSRNSSARLRAAVGNGRVGPDQQRRPPRSARRASGAAPRARRNIQSPACRSSRRRSGGEAMPPGPGPGRARRVEHHDAHLGSRGGHQALERLERGGTVVRRGRERRLRQPVGAVQGCTEVAVEPLVRGCHPVLPLLRPPGLDRREPSLGERECERQPEERDDEPAAPPPLERVEQHQTAQERQPGDPDGQHRRSAEPLRGRHDRQHNDHDPPPRTMTQPDIPGVSRR